VHRGVAFAVGGEMSENETVYKETLTMIARLDGPLTGEDATCFRTWAQEALEACSSEKQEQVETIPTYRVEVVCKECGKKGEMEVFGKSR